MLHFILNLNVVSSHNPWQCPFVIQQVYICCRSVDIHLLFLQDGGDKQILKWLYTWGAILIANAWVFSADDYLLGHLKFYQQNLLQEIEKSLGRIDDDKPYLLSARALEKTLVDMGAEDL